MSSKKSEASRIANLADSLSQRLETKSKIDAITSVIGTATGDSESGEVEVFISDQTLTQDNDGTAIKIPTNVNVQEGDTVQVSYNKNKPGDLTVTGIVGGGDRTAAHIAAAENNARVAKQAANAANTVSAEAKAAADATAQNFYSDDNGVHVTTEDGDETIGPNILANSQGILLRDGENVMSAQTPSGFTVYDCQNNYKPCAVFGATTVIGVQNMMQLVLDSDSIDLINSASQDSEPYFHVGLMSLPDNTLVSTIASSGGVASAYNSSAFSSGTASGEFSFAAAQGTAENYASIALGGRAYADYAIALGGSASGEKAISLKGTADGDNSLAFRGIATGNDAIAIGTDTQSDGDNSVAIGTGSKIYSGNGVAIGHYNRTKQDVIFVVGNGTESSPSDALLIDSTGTRIAGHTIIDGTTSTHGISNTGNITATGEILDTPTSEPASIGAGITSESSCIYVKSGHIVQLYIWAKITNAIGIYSVLNGVFRNLPKAVRAGNFGPLKIDGSTGSCFVSVDTDGVLALVTRETAIAKNGVFTGSATYISSE